MKIREMSAGDYDEIIKIWKLCFKEHRVDTRERITGMIKRNPETCLVAEDNGKIIGTLLGSFDGRQALLYHLAIDEKHRGKGIGEKLVSEAEKRIRKKGAFKILFFCRNRETLVNYFKKTGFKKSRFVLMYKDLTK